MERLATPTGILPKSPGDSCGKSEGSVFDYLSFDEKHITTLEDHVVMRRHQPFGSGRRPKERLRMKKTETCGSFRRSPLGCKRYHVLVVWGAATRQFNKSSATVENAVASFMVH